MVVHREGMDVASAAVLAAAHGVFAPTRLARVAGCVYAGLALLPATAAPMLHVLRRMALFVTTCSYHVILDPDSALDAVPLLSLSMVLDVACLLSVRSGTDAFAMGYVAHVAHLYWIAGVSMAPSLGAAMAAIAAARPTLEVAGRLAVAAALPSVAAVATRPVRFRYLGL